MLKDLLSSTSKKQKRVSEPPPVLSPAPRSPSPPPAPAPARAPSPASPVSVSDDPCPTTPPPMTLEETLFSGLVNRLHAENRALKAKNEVLAEKAKAARRERADAVSALDHTKKALESKVVALEEKNAKLKMRLKNADALLSKTELWFEAYVKLSKSATVSHGIPSPGSSEAAAPSLPSSKSGRSSSNGHASDTGHAYPHAARAVASPPPSALQNGHAYAAEKQAKTRRVTSEPLPASQVQASVSASGAPRVHYSPYSPHPTAAPAPAANGALSRQSSHAQLAQRSSQQHLSQRASQAQLAQRASQAELTRAAHPVQRTQGILQRNTASPAPAPAPRAPSSAGRRSSADQPLQADFRQAEYWASQFDERLAASASRTEHKAPPPPSTYAPPPSTYYPPTQSRARRGLARG